VGCKQLWSADVIALPLAPSKTLSFAEYQYFDMALRRIQNVRVIRNEGRDVEYGECQKEKQMCDVLR
jgi:hypothetical protein